ncbi:MAG: PQQ-binding-like beta-propeller repeat protein [Thermoguttaceae bacterium]
MVSAEKGLPDWFNPGEKKPDGSGIDPASTKNVKWVARLGSQTYGNVAVAGGKVFVGTNDFAIGDGKYQSTRGGLLKCFDESSGKLLWKLVVPKFETNKPTFNYDNIDLGICSAPTVDGNRVYLVTNRGEVLCLDTEGMANGNDGPFMDEGKFSVPTGKKPVSPGPSDGDIIWRFDMVHEIPVWPQDASNCSILVHGDFLYVCTSNGVDSSHDRLPFPDAPTLIVLDKKTGRMVAHDEEFMGRRCFHGEWSNPSLGHVNGKDLVFLGGGDGICYAFEALTKMPQSAVGLRKAWSFDCNPPELRLENGKPIPYRRGDVRLHRGNKNDGTCIGPSEIIATPVCYKDRVYVTIGQDPSHGRGRGMLSCIDATKTGDITKSGCVWRFDKIGRSLSTVSIAGGLLYVADTFGGLYCMDPDTGRVFWSHQFNQEIWGSTLVADGKIYLGTQKSFWILAAGKKKKILHELKLGAPSYCTPVVANGVLYVTSHRYLWAVQEGRIGEKLVGK